MLYFRYVSLLRQRSTTTTSTTLEDAPAETTTVRESSEEPKTTKFTKVSDETFITESTVTSTTLPSTEPFTEIITTTVNVPAFTVAKNSEPTQTLTTIAEKPNVTLNTETVPMTVATIKNNTPPGTTEIPILFTKNTSDGSSATKAPTSTITNVITSVYEGATERQRVRVKNIQNFLLEHKKTEPVTQPISHATTTSSTTVENMIAVEEPTQKSILKGRFGGPVHFRPTLRKTIGVLEKTTTTEKTSDTTTERQEDTTTEKKFRPNKYVNRFARPVNNNTENTSTAGRRFVRTSTESTLESSTRQFNRFRPTTSSDVDNSALLTRRSFSRFRSTSPSAETPSTTTSSGSAEVQKSRFFRSRRPVPSAPTPTTAATTDREPLKSEENVNNVRYEKVTRTPPTTTGFPSTGFPSTGLPSTGFEEFSTNDDEFRVTTIDGFEPTKYGAGETTTAAVRPTTFKISKPPRGSVRTNGAPEDGKSSSGRHNSRFLKDEEKILFIRVLPSSPADGRSRNELAPRVAKNVTRSRGKIRAFDSLELVTVNDGLTDDDDRPTELFRGSETKFRARLPATANATTTSSTTAVVEHSTAEV